MMKQFAHIVLIILLFVSCKGKEGYLIEGKITSLDSLSICFVVPNLDGVGVKMDTVPVGTDGKFSYEGFSQDLSPVVLYMEGGNVWTTVWTQNKDVISISGDIHYPELIVAKGGDINDLLADFRVKNKTLLMEKRKLMDQYSSDIANIDSLETNGYTDYESKILNIDLQLKNMVEKFIEENPSSIASLVLVQDYLMDVKSQELFQTCLAKISGVATQNPLYEKLMKVSKKLDLTALGAKAPDFMLHDIKNDTIRLNSFKGKYFLLTFAASWCEPCNKNNEDLVSLYKDLNQKQFTMLTVSLDEDSAAWKNVVKDKKMLWYQVIDTNGWGSNMVSKYNVTEIPSNLLIDKESIIVGKNLPADSIKKIIKTVN